MNNAFIMMCYKYWLESKTRFLIAVVLLTALVFYAVSQSGNTIRQHPLTHAGRIINFTQYVWVILYKGYFLTIFICAAFIFGLGGPMQEKQTGSASFTLSLPVYRSTILRSKILVAVGQVIALSLIGAFVVIAFSALYQYHYPVKDALLFSCLMSTGGLLFMLLGIYLSLFISKPMIVPALGVAIIAAVFFITRLPALKPVNIFNYITGAGYLSNESFLFVGNINRTGTGIIILIALVSIIIAERIFKRMDV